ncbi:MAG TPA: hypothetical protein VNH11_05245 [Pirellulales bacterium]|nr:hypothetical protein [Pirellulales bacterium]
MPVSLPGDGEDVPAAEKELRDRLHALRRGLRGGRSPKLTKE